MECNGIKKLFEIWIFFLPFFSSTNLDLRIKNHEMCHNYRYKILQNKTKTSLPCMVAIDIQLTFFSKWKNLSHLDSKPMTDLLRSRKIDRKSKKKGFNANNLSFFLSKFFFYSFILDVGFMLISHYKWKRKNRTNRQLDVACKNKNISPTHRWHS